MNIILASSEVIPFAKTGGLADVAGALPRELERLGHRVIVFMPGYRIAVESGQTITPTDVILEIPVGPSLKSVQLLRSKLPDSEVDIYLVQHDDYFDRPGLYGELGQDYPDNADRFICFCRAVLEAIRVLDLPVDLIHANDWQTGLLPALLACEYRENPIYRDIACLLTIHNLAYQGLFDRDRMSLTGLDPAFFNWKQMEFHGHLNLLKTGIVFADAVNTVSPTYAAEIQTAEQGCGLEGVLRHRSSRLSGIINGIDTDVWNPMTDPNLQHHFSSDFDPHQGCDGKAACKQSLQEELHLDQRSEVPLIGIVGRLASQKGWSLILPVLRSWLEQIDAQWVILGTGDQDYHHVLSSLHRSHPRKLSLTLGFSDSLAHRIEAGADLFLMPSQYEPCGLNQMYSMAYGTLPVVHRTGGLADTVVHANSETIENGTATGFSFTEFTAAALDRVLHQAVDTYRQRRPVWNQLMVNGMTRDWSWTASAARYESLYQQTRQYRMLDASTGELSAGNP